MATETKLYGQGIQIEGLREWVKELRQAPERLDKPMRAQFREIAAEVRTKARAAAQEHHPPAGPNTGRPHKQHWSALVSSITSGADSDTPWLKLGSERVPWALGFEFGSRKNRYPQFPVWRGFGRQAGYFFWPAIRAEEPDMKDRMLKAVDETFALAYPDGAKS